MAASNGPAGVVPSLYDGVTLDTVAVSKLTNRLTPDGDVDVATSSDSDSETQDHDSLLRPHIRNGDIPLVDEANSTTCVHCSKIVSWSTLVSRVAVWS